MFKTTLIFVIALLPACYSWLAMRRLQAQARARLRSALDDAYDRRFRRPGQAMEPDYQYIEGVGYMLGNLTCRFNARSPYLRCTANPLGPCQGCSHYESIEFPA